MYYIFLYCFPNPDRVPFWGRPITSKDRKTHNSQVIPTDEE